MGNITRRLVTDEEINLFLASIDFEELFADEGNCKRCFPRMDDINAMLSQTITLIKQANRDLLDVMENNTYVSDKHRTPPYISNEKRQELIDKIVVELSSQIRLENDDEMCLGKDGGGMLPKSGIAKDGKKAFVIIGLPASGKSGIAKEISDYYDAVIIDSDFVKRKIPEYCAVNGASLVHMESKMIKDGILYSAINKGINIVYPIIGSEYDDVVLAIRNLRHHRYDVSVILVELDRIKATQRALCRFLQTKRYIPLSRILDEYSNNPSLVFYKLLQNKQFEQMPFALIDTDVPFGTAPKIMFQRNFRQIHNIIK